MPRTDKQTNSATLWQHNKQKGSHIPRSLQGNKYKEPRTLQGFSTKCATLFYVLSQSSHEEYKWSWDTSNYKWWGSSSKAINCHRQIDAIFAQCFMITCKCHKHDTIKDSSALSFLLLMYFALSRPICPCVPRRLIVWNKIGEFSEALKFPGRTNALAWVCSSAGLKVNTYCWYQKSKLFSKYLRQEFQLSRFPFEGSHQMSRDSTPGIKDGFFRFSRPDYSPFQQTCQSHENFAIFQRQREVGLTKFNRGLFESTISKLVSEG